MTTDLDPIPREEIVALVTACIANIGDNYRAPDDDGDEPSMQLTIACDDACTTWSYQTGDNSFSGGAYCLPHWAVVTLTRNCDPEAVTDEIFSQWGDLIVVDDDAESDGAR